METINNDNYELWLVRYADGELTDAECKAVEQWLKQHPEAAGELKLYCEAPRLERDEAVVYAATVSQHSETVRPLWLTVLRWSAAAVALLALLPLVLRMFKPAAEVPVLVAEVEQIPAVGTRRAVSAEDEALVVGTRRAVSAEDEALAVGTRRAVSATAKVRHSSLADTARCVPTVEAVLVAEEVPAVEAIEPVLVAAVEPLPVPCDTVLPCRELIYVDNLFTVDSGSVIEQRLLAANEAVKERLQGTWLGRRLARRMPTDEELLDYTDNLRERTPQGIRMVTDLFLAYNESNK